MQYDLVDLEEKAKELLRGRSERSYLQQAGKAIAHWLEQNPNRWKNLGPYYPVVRTLLDRYAPEFDQEWKGAMPVPDYLRSYGYGSELLDCIAALLYLNRDGDYVSNNEEHSIVLPNGDDALFIPGSGLCEN